jgi:hypothetical protein
MRDGVSKITSARDLHAQKQPEQIISTLFGLQIDNSDEQERNTFDSIRRRFDRGSKMTSHSERHRANDSEQRTSTYAGIQIDDSDLQLEKQLRENPAKSPAEFAPSIGTTSGDLRLRLFSRPSP